MRKTLAQMDRFTQACTIWLVFMVLFALVGP